MVQSHKLQPFHVLFWPLEGRDLAGVTQNHFLIQQVWIVLKYYFSRLWTMLQTWFFSQSIVSWKKRVIILLLLNQSINQISHNSNSKCRKISRSLRTYKCWWHRENNQEAQHQWQRRQNISGNSFCTISFINQQKIVLWNSMIFLLRQAL